MDKNEYKILSHTAVQRKIRRMSFQVYEQNFEEKDLVMAGISGTGYLFARLLAAQLAEVSPITCLLAEIKLDKKAPLQTQVSLSVPQSALAGKAVVIADDVLNTGKTIVHSLKPFLEIPLRKLQVAVLVNRGHRHFPVSPDFVGYELSTTVNQHIEVDLRRPDNFSVQLF